MMSTQNVRTADRFEERAAALVADMTLAEKVLQLLHDAPEIERLGIPSYNWWSEALHGVARAGVATVFPQAIGLGATFDTELIGEIAAIIATEGRAKFHEFQRRGDHGIYKGLTFWSPNVNIFRDPRWGRGQETFGEDPFLSGRMGVTFIHGLQGENAVYWKSAACVKHFAVHSGPEAERHSFDARVDDRDLHETYLPAFRDCVLEGEVAGVMGAYNRTNGEPCCGSERLLVKLLRGDWGFDGYVTSDCWAIQDFNEHHGVTANITESVALALRNGCDLNCGCAYSHLMRAVADGMITEEEIDLSARRLFTIRMRLGLFDEPEKVPFTATPYEANDCPTHTEKALHAAKSSVVLLKNAAALLPLNASTLRSIAVIGPNADSRAALEGNYCGTASEYITVLEGIREAVAPGTRVYYAQGCHLYRDRQNGLGRPDDRLSEAVSAVLQADLTVLCLGLDASIEGEQGDTGNEYSSGDRKTIDLPESQQRLLEVIAAQGKPFVVIYMAGSAITSLVADEQANAILHAWYPGAQGGRALASILFGGFNPCARLPVTVYRSMEDLPPFEDYAMENRTYRFLKTLPLYPFGFGLSYTRFAYRTLLPEETVLPTGAVQRISVSVRNEGDVAGAEVVQLYLSHPDTDARTPQFALAGFRKVFLAPGEETDVTFTLNPRSMAIVGTDGRHVIHPGTLRVFVGGSQPDERSVQLLGAAPLSIDFRLEGESLILPV